MSKLEAILELQEFNKEMENLPEATQAEVNKLLQEVTTTLEKATAPEIRALVVATLAMCAAVEYEQ